MAKMELPEASLVRKTLIIRKLDLPESVLLTKRSLLRWLALSLGLISEKESRKMAIEILDALFHYLFSMKRNPSAEQIKRFLEEKRNIRISERLVRYHLNKLIELGILTRKNACYCINPAPQGERDDIIKALEYYTREELEHSLEHIKIAMEKLIEKYR
ncbi:MAG: hypothetical protein J7L44_00580 [Candidatus Diapherotrites archaeon]|nr:hypothetical protein [Candidatus Diapherotrites archaeon]